MLGIDLGLKAKFFGLALALQPKSLAMALQPEALASGSFLGLDSWGVSTSGWGSGLVGIEYANAQNSYCDLLGGYQETNPRGVLYESWGVIIPLRGCRKLPAWPWLCISWPYQHQRYDDGKKNVSHLSFVGPFCSIFVLIKQEKSFLFAVVSIFYQLCYGSGTVTPPEA